MVIIYAMRWGTRSAVSHTYTLGSRTRPHQDIVQPHSTPFQIDAANVFICFICGTKSDSNKCSGPLYKKRKNKQTLTCNIASVPKYCTYLLKSQIDIMASIYPTFLDASIRLKEFCSCHHGESVVPSHRCSLGLSTPEYGVNFTGRLGRSH